MRIQCRMRALNTIYEPVSRVPSASISVSALVEFGGSIGSKGRRKFTFLPGLFALHSVGFDGFDMLSNIHKYLRLTNLFVRCGEI
jgi:hypothetical protein